MGRLIETVGNYAEIPYYMAQANISVYCVEELCYAFCQNTFLLDRGLLDVGLVKWLESECGLKNLARPLYELVSKNGSPSAFVGMILEYAHYGSEKKRKETEELLRLGADMDASTRRKNFADYLVENGRYAQAVTEYEKVLEEMPSMNHVMRSELFHNKGVALCRLFSFQEAAEAFQMACQENPENGEAAVSFLAALRMSLSEGDYLAFIAEHQEWYESSLEVEKRMGMVQKEYEKSDACRELTELLEKRDTVYYTTVSEKLAQMQKKYREMVAQP